MNQYSRDMWDAMKMTHAPVWGQKLSTPAFYSDEKYARFFEHWKQRLGLEMLKIKHASEHVDQDSQ